MIRKKLLGSCSQTRSASPYFCKKLWRTPSQPQHPTNHAAVVGCGACLLPFTFAPVAVTLACFEAFGLINGPFIPLTYALFQSATTTANLPTILAAPSAIIMIATPLGTAFGDPLGAAETLTATGAATFLLAAAVSVLWAAPSTLMLLVDLKSE